MSNILKESLGKLETEHIRSNIERIISSYRHVWDIFTELLQNSADAIFDKYGEDGFNKGEISLTVRPDQRLIIIEDNGIGIAEEDLSKILVNGKSIKRENNSGKYGFMGFGFTYIAFQTKVLVIESVKDGKLARKTYLNLYKFVFENTDIPNSFEEENDVESKSMFDESRTKIIIKFPEELPNDTLEQNIVAAFRIARSAETMNTVLRTKTVVGLLDKLFSNSDAFNFKLKIDNDFIPVETGYLSTREIVKNVLHSENQFYEMSQYENIINITQSMNLTSQDHARKAVLIDKIITNVKIGDRSPLIANFHITATSKSHINTFNEQFIYDKDKSDFQIEHGVWLSIAGMPIGVCLDTFDHSNYLPFTIVVDIQDSSIRKELDAGRKGISSYRMYQIAEKARELLVEHNFIKYRRYVVGGSDSRISNPLYDPKMDLKSKLAGKILMPVDFIQKYLPPIEEQEVITLFIELMSRGILKGYNLKILSGYAVYDGLLNYDLPCSPSTMYSGGDSLGIAKQVFDMHGRLQKDDVFVEFKTKLRSIYKDIETNKKDLSHIDILICWDTESEQATAIQKEKGDLLSERDLMQNVYYGVTHKLIGQNRQQPLPIIELKRVLAASGITLPPGVS